MYIDLLGRGDRLGANITCFIAQIIYAVNNNIYIKFDRKFIESGDNVRFVPYNQDYNNSVFISTLFDFIDIHNSKLVDPNTSTKDNMFSIHFFELISRVTINIKQDHFSFFKERIYPDIKDIFFNKSHEKGYTNIIPFNPKKTILVHLRLDDTRNCRDYDGRVCSQHFIKTINNDVVADNNTDNEIKSTYPGCNYQAPLSKDKLQTQIDAALKKHPDYEVILVTTPNENTSVFPYRCIQNNDESLDLFLLCNSEVVILSRSTFALSCLYFGIAKDIYVPVWGHTACFGLGLINKFDESKFNYFY
jgi:hypothetical protein